MKVSKKIKQLLKGKQYTKWTLLPDDEIEIKNNENKPIVVYIERAEWSFFGSMFNKLNK